MGDSTLEFQLKLEGTTMTSIECVPSYDYQVTNPEYFERVVVGSSIGYLHFLLRDESQKMLVSDNRNGILELFGGKRMKNCAVNGLKFV